MVRLVMVTAIRYEAGRLSAKRPVPDAQFRGADGASVSGYLANGAKR